MIVCPARLEPVFSPRPWGARSLAPYFPEMTGLAEPVGEAWLSGSECRFADGPFAGMKLGEAWPKMPPEWAGTKADTAAAFPLLVKFIFSEEKLSVQVHPDDEYAAKHEQAVGGRGKTEMWYAVKARPGAEVLVGLKPEVTREGFARAIGEGTAEDCLVRVPVSQGDAIFVPAGTAHTIGPGLVLCEIQQNSDLTYRVYDYNRRDAQGRGRELHIEKALDVMRFGKQLGGKVEPVQFNPKKAKSGRGLLSLLTACRYFAVEKIELRPGYFVSSSMGYFELMVVIDGVGSIAWKERDERVSEYSRGQVWLIPAALGSYAFEVKSTTTLLRTYVPDLDALAEHYEKSGVTAEEIRRLVLR